MAQKNRFLALAIIQAYPKDSICLAEGTSCGSTGASPEFLSHIVNGNAQMVAGYEDNFGFWDIDGKQEQAFFNHVQRESLPKTCDRCEQEVLLMPSKTLCASCVTAREYGAPESMSKY